MTSSQSPRHPRSPAPAAAPPSTDRDGASRLPVALQHLGAAELIALLAISMSMTALGIDLLLPAFPDVRADLGLAADSNATAGLVTTYFLGLAIGQLFFGVLADGRGRRVALYVGYGLYGLGALASFLAPGLTALLAARVVWGVGAAAGRVVTLAVIRDTWSGDKMSRAMSFVMAVFILVPIVSPALGQALLVVVSWRWLFAVCAIATALVSLWAIRLPETLAVDDRRSMRPGRVLEAARIAARQRPTVAGGVGLMLLYGAFTSWIGSAELIIGDVFDLTAWFPYIFGGLASVLGAGMLLNSQIVERFGTAAVTRVTLVVYLAVAAFMVAMTIATAGSPPFWAFAAVLALLLGCHALLVPNVNAIAMEPVGQIAGTASALIGATQIAGGALLGALVDRFYDGTVLPLSLGFLGFGVVGALVILWGVREIDGPTERAA